MKVVHKRLAASPDQKHASEQESSEDQEKAIASYEKLIKRDPVNENAYRRLMIIYRKQRNYRKELAVIRAGIKSFEDHYKPSPGLLANKKVTALSKALMKSTGLADNKGNPMYQKEPIGGWTRRKLIVEKKLKEQVRKS